jgi:hypothetical protein
MFQKCPWKYEESHRKPPIKVTFILCVLKKTVAIFKPEQPGQQGNILPSCV